MGDSKSKDAEKWASKNINATSTLADNLQGFALIVTTVYMVSNYYYIMTQLNGSWMQWFALIQEKGFIGTFQHTYPTWEEIVASMHYVWRFMAVQLAFMALVPGPMHKGPVAPSGHIPTYKANGTACFTLTLILWAAGSYAGFWTGGVIYDIYPGMIAGLNIFSLFFTSFLCLKGLFFPSTPDSGSTGSIVMDFFWGTELYPRVGHWLWSIGWDLKLFTNCRFGMIFWGLSVCSYAAKQYEMYGFLSSSMLVSSLTQVVYVFKFFNWEMGYMHTMDIQHDRAGFYICWGCLVWVPLIYTCHTLYLTNNPFELGYAVTGGLIALGLLGVWVNFQADEQKRLFRESDGKALIWGKPAKKIEAPYTTARGESKTNLLLASGWWGVSRHFHYIPELTAAFVWCSPALWGGTIAGFSYFPFLVILLFTRAFRDDERCRSKYGASWDEYCRLVPYKIIPYVV